MTDDLIARLRHEAIARSGYAHEYADGRTVWHPVCNEAADALEAQARRIAELEAQTKSAEACCDSYATENQQFHDRIEAQAARIAILEAALKPFADKAKVFHDYVDDYPIMFGAEPPLRVGDLRAARAALGEKE